MKQQFVFVSILCKLLLTSSVNGQQIKWQNTIGGNSHDCARYVEKTSDGGFILGGDSMSGLSGDKTEGNQGISSDIWIIKVDSSGIIEWQNTIGGTSSDYLYGLQQTTDGGYILGAISSSNASPDKSENSKGSGDFWLVKMDSTGIIQWENTIGGSLTDEMFDVHQTYDGGFILGGFSFSNISFDKSENSKGGRDYWVIKTSILGTIQFQNTIGGSGDDYLQSVRETNDGGYILGGYSNSGISSDKTEGNFGGTDYWIVKLDATAGQIQWQLTLGGITTDVLSDIELTNDGGYIVAGYSDSGLSGNKSVASYGGYDYWVVKLDQAGNISWQKNYGGSLNDKLGDIAVDYDGGYLLCGESTSGISGNKTDTCRGLADYWIVKIDTMGNLLWQHTIGGSDGEKLFSIDASSPSAYIVGGWSKSGISGEKTEGNMGNPTTYDHWIMEVCEQSHQTMNIISCDQYISPSGNHIWTASGTYQDTIFNSGGCDSIFIINLTIGNPMIFITAQSAITFCNGDSVILHASSGMTSYQWYRYNIPISGATGSNYTAKSKGKYKCVAFNAAQCSDTSNIITVNVPCIQTGPNNERNYTNNDDVDILIYPNPGSGSFIIKSLSGTLQITNSLGELVFKTEIIEGENLIDISDLPGGIYICSLQNENFYLKKKFILNSHRNAFR